MAHSQQYLVNIGQGMSLMIGMPTIALWDTKNRPKKPSRGTFGFNYSTNNLEYWNGSHWMATTLSKIEN